ncbi:MAG: ABC transporter ATP-binding protein [Actinomycetales bacterium]|nr:ABC transporter ATP-binding protein [Actinomycetales bacterium]
MSSTTLSLRGVTRRFKDTVALNSLDLDVAQGELVAMLGPSGCGKTTALRIIAGLDRPDEGAVLVGGQDVSHLPPNKRNMGMVFQSYSLFPNLTAAENVAFGLTMRKESKRARLTRAQDLLEMVGLPKHAKRFPHQLSGGQQQRVALARALAFEPDVLLLDEPLSALDAQVRANLRDEIRALQLKTGTTTIFVTHDQEEAMAMSDRVAVMNGGKIAQIARPDELYHNPADEFVAGFVGQMNRIPVTLEGHLVNLMGKQVSFRSDWAGASPNPLALVRPEDLTVASVPSADHANARVLARAFLGPLSKVSLELGDGTEISAVMTSSNSLDFAPGDAVQVSAAEREYLVVAG